MITKVDLQIIAIAKVRQVEALYSADPGLLRRAVMGGVKGEAESNVASPTGTVNSWGALGCWRSPNTDHFCSMKIDQGRTGGRARRQ